MFNDYEREMLDANIPEELENLAKVETQINLEVSDIEAAIQNHIANNVQSVIRKFIQKEVRAALKNEYGSKVRFDDLLKEIIHEELSKRFPEAIDDKIDELEKSLREYKHDWSRDKGHWLGSKNTPTTIKDAAKSAVDSYIETELAKEVTKTKEFLNDFSKQYFANNLFKVMGMMSSFEPQSELGKELLANNK